MVLLSLLSYGLILWGTLWLLLELWIWRTRSKLRHRITGQPIPATPFFDLLWLLVRNSFGSQSDPIGTFVYARFAINHDNWSIWLERVLMHKKELGDTYLVWRGWYPLVISSNFDGIWAQTPNWQLLTLCIQTWRICSLKKATFTNPIFHPATRFWPGYLVGTNPCSGSSTNNNILKKIKLGKSLVSVSGEMWKRQRKTMNPAFKYKKLKTLVPLFSQAAEKLLRYSNLLV